MKCLVRRVVELENELEELRKPPRPEPSLPTHAGLSDGRASAPDRLAARLGRGVRSGEARWHARLLSRPALVWPRTSTSGSARPSSTPAGPLLVLAGAGSGKTRVLTYRLAHLIQSGQVRPHQTLAITFTNKAAGEMKERVAGLLGPASGWMWVCTFHSACARMLRQDAPLLGYRPASPSTTRTTPPG